MTPVQKRFRLSLEDNYLDIMALCENGELEFESAVECFDDVRRIDLL